MRFTSCFVLAGSRIEQIKKSKVVEMHVYHVYHNKLRQISLNVSGHMTAKTCSTRTINVKNGLLAIVNVRNEPIYVALGRFNTFVNQFLQTFISTLLAKAMKHYE